MSNYNLRNRLLSSDSQYTESSWLNNRINSQLSLRKQTIFADLQKRRLRSSLKYDSLSWPPETQRPEGVTISEIVFLQSWITSEDDLLTYLSKQLTLISSIEFYNETQALLLIDSGIILFTMNLLQDSLIILNSKFVKYILRILAVFVSCNSKIPSQYLQKNKLFTSLSHLFNPNLSHDYMIELVKSCSNLFFNLTWDGEEFWEFFIESNVFNYNLHALIEISQYLTFEEKQDMIFGIFNCLLLDHSSKKRESQDTEISSLRSFLKYLVRSIIDFESNLKTGHSIHKHDHWLFKQQISVLRRMFQINENIFLSHEFTLVIPVLLNLVTDNDSLRTFPEEGVLIEIWKWISDLSISKNSFSVILIRHGLLYTYSRLLDNFNEFSLVIKKEIVITLWNVIIDDNNQVNTNVFKHDETDGWINKVFSKFQEISSSNSPLLQDYMILIGNLTLCDDIKEWRNLIKEGRIISVISIIFNMKLMKIEGKQINICLLICWEIFDTILSNYYNKTTIYKDKLEFATDVYESDLVDIMENVALCTKSDNDSRFVEWWDSVISKWKNAQEILKEETLLGR